MMVVMTTTTIMMMMFNDDDLAGPRKRHHGSWSEGPGHSCLPGGSQPDQVNEALAGETGTCPEFLLCRFLLICAMYKPWKRANRKLSEVLIL